MFFIRVREKLAETKEVVIARKKTRFRCVAQRGWYFLTREGRIGPFNTRREAELMCQRYMREMSAKTPPAKEAQTTPEKKVRTT